MFKTLYRLGKGLDPLKVFRPLDEFFHYAEISSKFNEKFQYNEFFKIYSTKKTPQKQKPLASLSPARGFVFRPAFAPLFVRGFGGRGGEGGIRTPGTVTRTPHFECGPFNHSGTSPFGGTNIGVFWESAGGRVQGKFWV